ncbi:phosphoribosyltransferase [Herbiconiux sp. P16]|uniref:phosphoribosyltransferase n=1 Tax=Herbiconiux wuyangfengii TaxID=3342794 RepID=UPI0035B756AE
MDRFRDRRDAGRQLGRMLMPTGGPVGSVAGGVVVLGLPRGGVIVAAEVAAMLGAPLDVILVRKLGLPGAPEVAMGAIAEGGIRYLDAALVARFGVSDEELARVESSETRALDRRAHLLRHGLASVGLDGKVAIVVDDGVATGATARVACRAGKARGAARVVFATPVGAPSALSALEDADEVVCALTPDPFGAVGRYYADFRQTTDADVLRALA